MRTSLLITVFTLFFIGCDLGGDNDDCGTRIDVSGVEFFVEENPDGTLNLASQEDNFQFATCESFPLNFDGYEGIYYMEGSLVTDCNSNTCFEIDLVARPDCKPDYELNRDAQYTLFGTWKIAYILQETDTLFPPCSLGNLPINIRRDAVQETEFPHYISGNVSNNTTELFFRFSEDTIFTTNYSISRIENGPYTQIFEDRVDAFLRQTDTLLYNIEFNTLDINDPNEETVIRLYQ